MVVRSLLVVAAVALCALTWHAAVVAASEPDTTGYHVDVLEKADPCETRPSKGDVVFIEHTGRAAGQVIDSNGNEPLSFRLGKDYILPGMEKAISSMCVGDKVRATIPPQLAFDARPSANKPVPAGTTVQYEIKLIDAITPGSPRQLLSGLTNMARDIGPYLLIPLGLVVYFLLYRGAQPKGSVSPSKSKRSKKKRA